MPPTYWYRVEFATEIWYRKLTKSEISNLLRTSNIIVGEITLNSFQEVLNHIGPITITKPISREHLVTAIQEHDTNYALELLDKLYPVE